ncbi:MAG: TIGR04283 family arsenosugar biosynthesis glycosyltransferase [Burkholderiales bacterium]
MKRADPHSDGLVHGGSPWLSIVIPVLDEAQTLATALALLQPLRARSVEVIVVDGGSRDGSAGIARPFADQVLESARGRALQMNVGARAARGSVLIFLHADTRLPPAADDAIRAGLQRSGCRWGRFDVRFSGDRCVLRLVAFLMNQRSRLTGIVTGDQAMFVRRAIFEKVGGFPPLALMEDVALSARLKREGPPLCLRPRVVTSSRKWEREGALRTIWLMWRLRLAFFCGADPGDLARRYYRGDGQLP